MTTYFDQVSTDIWEIGNTRRSVAAGVIPAGKEDFSWYDAVYELEARLVRDCSIASMFPDFPIDLRGSIARAVLAFAPHSQPHNRKSEFVPDPVDESDHEQMLARLNGALHDIFHALASRQLAGWNDNPLAPLLRFAYDALELREDIVVTTGQHKAEPDVS